jgi:hypothetical protein
MANIASLNRESHYLSQALRDFASEKRTKRARAGLSYGRQTVSLPRRPIRVRLHGVLSTQGLSQDLVTFG